MFTTLVKEGKAFAAEQKHRELKTRISKVNPKNLQNSTNKNNFKFC